MNSQQPLMLDYQSHEFASSAIVHADCFEWMGRIATDSMHAIVTDPPYGVKEYDFDQIEKRANGNGGIWRIPPSFDGSKRAPLPRFTALNPQERKAVYRFFLEWGSLCERVLLPGGHILIASNAFLSQLVFSALADSGLEFRGELIRLVRTFRIFRKSIPHGMTVSDCLRTYGTGGLRRISSDQPFTDVIVSERTPRRERDMADHPSLKPQSFLRQVVRAALPLGTGTVLDPFMGSGSTVAAAEAQGICSIGIERFADYFALAKLAIPKLARLAVETNSSQLNLLDLLEA